MALDEDEGDKQIQPSTAMLTTQWDSNAVYKMQIIIEHKSSKRVKAYKLH